jgi:hypothetical protein
MLVISSLWYLAPVLVSGTARTERKVFRAWEIISKMRDTDYGKMPGAETIFSFNQEKFDFEPNDPKEVVRRSEKLREIGRDAYGEKHAVRCMAWELKQKADTILSMLSYQEAFSDFTSITKGVMIRFIELKRERRKRMEGEVSI